MKQYILKNKKPVLCTDIVKWGQWMSSGINKHVAKTTKGNVTVSTIFLGIDHNFINGGNPPILFETMIFGGQYNEEQWRYCTWEEAEEGHKKACQLVGLTLIYIVQKILKLK